LVALFIAASFAILLQPHLQSLRQLGVESTVDNLLRSTVYPRVVIAVNYFQDGFIRRGLPGTLTGGSSLDPRLRLVLFVVCRQPSWRFPSAFWWCASCAHFRFVSLCI
jgi:hypothetical protein